MIPYASTLTPKEFGMSQTVVRNSLNSDISAAFSSILKNVHTALQEIHPYFTDEHGVPTFDENKSIDGKIKYFAMKRCTFGQSDIPALFKHLLENAAQVYLDHYPENGTYEFPKFDINRDYTANPEKCIPIRKSGGECERIVPDYAGTRRDSNSLGPDGELRALAPAPEMRPAKFTTLEKP